MAVTAAVAAAAVAFAASGGEPAPARTASGPHPKPAAEPADSPPTAVRPAGTSSHVGGEPEGIVVDPATGTVAVGVRSPDELVLLDADSGRVRRRVRLPGPPRHLQLGPGVGTVLVPAESDNSLIVVDARTGSITAKVGVREQPHDATAAAGRIYVGDEFGRAVSVISGGRVVGEVRGFTQPGGLAPVLGAVAVVDVGADTVSLIDTRTARTVARVPAGDGPTHVVATGARLFVIDTRGGAVLEYTSRPRLRFVRRFALPGAPYGVAIDPRRRRLWVTLTARNRVVELAIGATGLRRVRSFPTGRQPNTVAVDPRTGHLFVADAQSGDVEQIDPTR